MDILFKATLNLDSSCSSPRLCVDNCRIDIKVLGAERGVERLEKRIDVVMDPNNPAVAGKYLREDYVITCSDLPILENNLKMV